jgi:hypothetical protein
MLEENVPRAICIFVEMKTTSVMKQEPFALIYNYSITSRRRIVLIVVVLKSEFYSSSSSPRAIE